MLCITLGAYRKLKKLKISSPDVEVETLSRLRQKMGIEKSVALKISPDIYTPVSLGIFSPTIILPDGVIKSPFGKGGFRGISELEMILTHELAHIKRRDYLINLLQNILRAIFFFHPLFHLLNRSLTKEREHICDDWVINTTNQRSGYARCIVSLLEKSLHKPVCVPVALSMAERKRDIPGRIDMIVDKKRRTTTKISRRAFIVLLLIGCLSIPVIGGIELVRIAGARPASNAGRIVFSRNDKSIWVMDADGKSEKQLTAGHNDGTPAWSPDGAQIAFFRYTDDLNIRDIYAMNADGSDIKQLTSGPENDIHPTWSPDGKQIAFQRSVWEEKDGKWKEISSAIYVMNSDGSDVRTLSEKGPPFFHGNPDWSPDGEEIAFEHPLPGDQVAADIWVIDADGSDWVKLDNRAKLDPAWSPDGKSIAVTGWSGNLAGIYVMDADGGNIQRLTELGSQARSPAWSSDGAEIAFCSDQGRGAGEWDIYVMDADGSNVRQLTDTPEEVEFTSDWTAFSYAVGPAGKLKSTWGKVKRGLFGE